MGTTMEAFPPSQSPLASHSLSRSFHPVEFLDELRDLSHSELNSSFRAQDEDELRCVITTPRPSAFLPGSR